MRRRGFLGALAAGVAALTAGKLPVVIPPKPSVSTPIHPAHEIEAINWLRRRGWEVLRIPDRMGFQARKTIAFLRRPDSAAAWAVESGYVPAPAFDRVDQVTLSFSFAPLATRWIQFDHAQEMLVNQVKYLAEKTEQRALEEIKKNR